MLCPKCGKEIADGSLFCSYCFADIHIVSTYDAKVEEVLSDAMEDVTRHVERETNRQKARTEREEEVERQRKKLGLIARGVVAGVVAAAIILLLFKSITNNTESHYVAQAYEKAADGDYAGAARDIETALALRETSSGDMELLLAKSEYEMKAGDNDAALETLQEMLRTAMDSSETLSAWSRIIEIYSSRGEYASIARLLRESADSEVQSTYRRYMIYDPRFDPPAGNYGNGLILTLTSDGDGSLFYTLDGSRPDTSSNLYTEPIVLPHGLTRVNAVYINHFGVASRTISRLYWVSDEDMDPDAVPTDEDDTEDTEEAEEADEAQDEDDTEAAEDTAVDDTVQTSAPDAVTDADGPSLIIQSLIRLGEPMTGDGTVQNGAARFVYGWQGRQSIGGHDYYTYGEMVQDNVGNSVNTGRSFAVDTATGAVYLIEGGGLSPVG